MTVFTAPLRSPLRRLLLAAALLASVIGSAHAAPFASERITVTTSGSGSDVVLIPGLASSPRVWAEMMAALPGHRYHLVKVAGFAGLPKGGNASGDVIAPVAEEVARYMREAGLGKRPVIGHSMGGTVTLMLAARHPEAVSKIMIVDMVPFLGIFFGPPGTTVASVKPTADAMFARMQSMDPAARAKNTSATINAMINAVAMRAGAQDDSITSDLDVVARVYHELLVTDLTPELANIKVPATVLYITPAGVPISDVQMDGVYQTAYAPLAGVKLTRIANSAHFIMWDQPARFQAEVKAFLD